MLPIKSSNVSVFILKPHPDEVKALLLRRARDLANLWCQVTGGIEEDEMAWQAALGEVREETGIVLQELWPTDIHKQFCEVGKEYIMLISVFVGIVPSDAEAVLNDEHDGRRWASFEEASKMFGFSGQRNALAVMKAGLVDSVPNPRLKVETGGQDSVRRCQCRDNPMMARLATPTLSYR